jgi:hypothetical protein
MIVSVALPFSVGQPQGLSIPPTNIEWDKADSIDKTLHMSVKITSSMHHGSSVVTYDGVECHYLSWTMCSVSCGIGTMARSLALQDWGSPICSVNHSSRRVQRRKCAQTPCPTPSPTPPKPTRLPTFQPTSHPTPPTLRPTIAPTRVPTQRPTNIPSPTPTKSPTQRPTTPTRAPTESKTLW